MTHGGLTRFDRIILLALILANLPLSLDRAEERDRAVPGEEAALHLHDLDGQPRDLGRYRGRIVVLNFWATWCLPCRDEMPVLAGVAETYGSRGVEVIAASTDDEGSIEAVRRFSRRQKLDFPVWVGATTRDMLRFGLGDALPATAVIDRNGEIAFRFIGVVTRDDLVARIEHLLGDVPGPAPPGLVRTLPEAGSDPEGEDHHEQEDEAQAGHAHDHGTGGDASLVPS